MSVFSSAQQKREQLAVLLGPGNKTPRKNGAASTGTCGNAKILGLDVLQAPSPIQGKRQKKVQQVPGTSTVAPAEIQELVSEGRRWVLPGSGGGRSRFLRAVPSGGSGADEVLGKALARFLHPAPGPLESLYKTPGNSKAECISQPWGKER